MGHKDIADDGIGRRMAGVIEGIGTIHRRFDAESQLLQKYPEQLALERVIVRDQNPPLLDGRLPTRRLRRKMGADYLEQPIGLHRLEEIIGELQLRLPGLIKFVQETRKQDNRRFVFLLGTPDALCHLEAVDVGENEIEENKVGSLIGHDIDGRLAIRRLNDLVAGVLQRATDQLPCYLTIVHDENG